MDAHDTMLDKNGKYTTEQTLRISNDLKKFIWKKRTIANANYYQQNETMKLHCVLSVVCSRSKRK